MLTESIPEVKLEYLPSEIPKFLINNPLNREYPTDGWDMQPFSGFDIENTKIQGDYIGIVRRGRSYPEKLGIIDHRWISLIQNYKKPEKHSLLTEYYTKLLQCQYADTSCTLPFLLMESTGSMASPIPIKKLFRSYLDMLVAKGVVFYEIRDTAWHVFENLQVAFKGKLQEPDAASGANHSLMLAFDDGLNHLEFEIIEEGRAEVFFLKRDTNDTWEMDYVVDSSLPDVLLEKVRLFLK